MAIILGRKGGGAGGGGGGPPSGAAGGDLGGSYPNPTLSAAKEAELDAAAAAAAAAQTTANAAVPKALYDANTVLAANSDDTPAALTMGASTILARLAAGNIKAASPSELRTLLDVPTNAEAVLDTLYDANTVLKADSDNTPAALTMGASTILARLASGNIVAATVAEMQTLLGLQVKIGGATLGAPAANIDITSIPGTYSHLRLQLVAATSDANATNVNFRFNNDGTSIYDYEIVAASAAVLTASEGLAQAQIIGATIPGTGAASMGGSWSTDLPGYSGTTFHKMMNTNGMYTTGTATTNIIARVFNGRWRSTVAISRITLTPTAGNFITGTTWTLYGIP